MKIYDEFMNNIKNQLLSVIGSQSDDFLNNISNNISNNYYSTFVINDSFLKIATIDNFHFNSLCNEIKLCDVDFETYQLKPTIIYTYCSQNIAIKLEKHIKGIPLGKNRDDFFIKIKYDEEILISKIKAISNLKADTNIGLLSYNRCDKILKYVDDCKELLSSALIEKCTQIAKEDDNNTLFLSHGDLIPSNILFKNNDFIFVDWEWAAFRSKTYDLTLFLLFSNQPYYILHNFKNYFDYNSLYSAYLDSILISLHEIKNWKNETQYTTNRKQNIEMWLLTLQKAVDLIENFNSWTQI